MNFKNILKYLLGAAVGAGLTVLIMTIFFKPEPKVEYICEEGYELRDTCLDNTLLCTLTTKDSFNIYRIIREGLKIKETNTRPKIEEVKVPDTAYNKPLLERKYTKYLNNGTVEVWDSLTVIGEIVHWQRSHQTNEVIEVQEKVTNNTAIIEKGNDDSQTIKYIPIETTPKQTWIGTGASIMYYDNLTVPVSLDLQSGKSTFSIYKDVTTDFGNLKGYGIGYRRNLIRVSTKQ